ncbi:dethiobiotin synthase [Williamsia sterculiae]|uniref:ATP-dependent dethiobiotin synthetase BioD n=1 Tax=Williamsia sterculiae TaxID=1344003 RepID=A0A1N7H617_9NOCA|nr:dethiobiotin synthase [Williamsia sterculiae]SIS20289.1 8-amino-7-oxononanoate synthase/dethiobiotin synthetase [Williamsia sterculiae]
MSVLVIAGTSTDVGKTVVTAAVAAAARAAGRRVAVCKPAQTGMSAGAPGDLAEVSRLVGDVTTAECVRYPDPLAPDTAARRAGMPALELRTVVDTVRALTETHDLTLVEGAGGVLVRLAADLTLLDVAAALGAPVLVVTPAGLGALNHAELTVHEIAARGLRTAGLVIGSWPDDPDLASTCNRDDLPRVTGVPIVGTIPAGSGRLSRAEFTARAHTWFDPGVVDAAVVDPTASAEQLTADNDRQREGVHP